MNAEEWIKKRDIQELRDLYALFMFAGKSNRRDARLSQIKKELNRRANSNLDFMDRLDEGS